MNEYFENFKKLCTGNAFFYSQPEFKNFRQSIDKTNYFDALKEFDKTFSEEVAGVLNLFYMRILEQPYWYIEAVELYPNDTDKQGQYLHDNIELAKDRLFDVFRGVDRITDQLDKLARNDRPSAQRLFEEILYITNELLKPKNIGCLSFEILSFNLKESPLFVVFMEFIEDKKNRAGNPYYSEIDQYLNNISLYKEKFQVIKSKPNQTETETEQKTLSNLITHKNSIDIVKNIKIQYRNIKGKRLKLLLKAFQDLRLLPKERIAHKFYNCCKNEFDWKIASYNAMNGYNYNERTDNNELNSMKQYLETLTKQI
ncbi:MAG: hypothetical protein HOO86_07120 [Bacteroidales bacterium]|nr:hypothetical protein [Bacteroidales bacterium]